MPNKSLKRFPEVVDVCLHKLGEIDVVRRVEYMPAKQDVSAGSRVLIHGEWGKAEYILDKEVTLSSTTLPLIIHRSRSYVTRLKTLLMTTYVSPGIAEKLHDNNIEFVDMAGNMFLKQPSLYIFVTGRKPEYSAVVDKGSAFSTPAGLKLVFLLLKHPEAVNWTHRVLAEQAGVSLGYVGSVLKSLRQRGYLRLAGLENQYLTNTKELLAKWENGYLERLRPKLLKGRYSMMDGGSVRDLLPAIRKNYTGGEVIIGGEMGASLITGTTRPEKATLHVSASASRVTAALKLIPGQEGNVTLLDTFGRQNARFDRKTNGLLVADPLLIHAEMMILEGERITDLAEQIFRDYLVYGENHDQS